MIRVISLAVAGVLALAGVAVATHKGAKTYKAELDPVATDATAPTGKAKLVDSKTNNKVKVNVKGLTPGASYEWHVHFLPEDVTDPCEEGATQGDIDTRFTYGELTANEDGNGSAKGKQDPEEDSFNVGDDEYYVNVHTPPGLGAPITCGVLTRKGPQGEAKGHDKP
jgi:hypothetical protein